MLPVHHIGSTAFLHMDYLFFAYFHLGVQGERGETLLGHGCREAASCVPIKEAGQWLAFVVRLCIMPITRSH